MKIARKIELLAPARNSEIGIAAIDHGADAVYIGAPKFSARSAAGNTLEDIQLLVEYAHRFYAKVYVAFNTILKDEELEEAECLIHQLYQIGVDALIIQDMGILELDLPPIALHASTQTDNRTLEKVQFLETAGFSQIVLARELSLKQIKEIASQTQVPLEVFVHGALCTSFSGQCYISQALSGRSANRGECAQYCRLPYTLKDNSGKILASNSHLLSLKDLNLSNHLEELLDAGVSSLKIEGRLKDIAYVKNITSYYRKKLDEILERRPEYQRASSGEATSFFLPNPTKSFNRGFTTYFLHGRNKDIASPQTPKSMGESVGNIDDLSSHYFTLKSKKAIHNGDGLCFLNEKKELQGFRVNKVEGNKIYPMEMPRLKSGISLFRNYDHEFERNLLKKSAERKIKLILSFEETAAGFSLTATDEDNCKASVFVTLNKETSLKPQEENIQKQLSKLGNTDFVLDSFSNKLINNWFIPSSVLSDLRRKVIDSLISVRKINRQRDFSKIQPSNHSYIQENLSYLGNVSNIKAADFYKKHGVKNIHPAFELEAPNNIPLMFTKHCLLHQLGLCPDSKNNYPLTLSTGKHTLTVTFHCKECEMRVWQ